MSVGAGGRNLEFIGTGVFGKLFQLSLPRQTQSVCACERSEAIHREAKQKAGLLRCARNDGIKGHTPTATHRSAFSRRECARGVREFPPFPWEGCGECRVPTHPQPRMQSKKAYELVTTGRPDDPAFPHAMVLTVSFVLSPVIGLDCHRRLACAKLDASVEASGPHDFAVRVQPRSSAVLTIASIASRPASVTIASAPRWDETARLGKCFAAKTNAFIFAIGTRQPFCPSGTERCGAVALAHSNVIASAPKQSSLERQSWIASSRCSSQ